MFGVGMGSRIMNSVNNNNILITITIIIIIIITIINYYR